MISPIGETPRCFISHAWRNGGHAFALEIRKQLCLRGLESWIDEKSILAGEHLKSSMRQGVLRQCNVFLAILTVAWMHSAPCQDELALALKRRDRDGVQIIPILRETLPEKPKGLEETLYVDFRDADRISESVNKLVEAITSGFFVYSMVTRLLTGARHERWQAAQHLGTLANPFVMPVLINRLVEETDPVARHWVAIAIGKTDGTEGSRALEQALTSETNEFVRTGIRAALKTKRHPNRNGTYSDQV